MKLERKILSDIYQTIHENCLKDLNSESYRDNEVSLLLPDCHIFIDNDENLFKIKYHYDGSYGLDILFRAIHSNSCVDKIKSLNLSYEYGAANGWMIIPLKEFLKDNAIYPNMKSFVMKHEADDTNMVEIIYDYSNYGSLFEESKTVCGQLMDAMPNIEKLTLLSSPSKTDIHRSHSNLKTLFVKCVFDHKDLLKNLSKLSTYQALVNFCFFDVDSYMGNEETKSTDFDSYYEFFNSEYYPNLRVLELHNVSLDDSQIETLKKQPLAKQVKILKIHKQKDGDIDWGERKIKYELNWFYQEFLNTNN